MILTKDRAIKTLSRYTQVDSDESGHLYAVSGGMQIELVISRDGSNVVEIIVGGLDNSDEYTSCSSLKEAIKIAGWRL